MPGEDKILSQAEIDELLSKKALKLKPRPPVANATATVKPPAPPPRTAVPLTQAPKTAAPPAPLPRAAAPPTQAPKTAVPPAPPPKAAVPPTPPPRAAAPPASPAGSVGASYQRYTSDEVANLQETVAELARHLVKISSVVQRVDKIEEKINQISAFIKLNPESSTLFERRLDEIHNILESLIQDKTDIRDEFHCSKCQSEKAVAVHVKCTTCGNENWMGWWPEAEQKQQGAEQKQQGAEQKQQDATGNP